MKLYIFVIAILAGILTTWAVLWFIYVYEGKELSSTGVIFLSLFVGATVQQLVRSLIFKYSPQHKK